MPLFTCLFMALTPFGFSVDMFLFAMFGDALYYANNSGGMDYAFFQRWILMTPTSYFSNTALQKKVAYNMFSC